MWKYGTLSATRQPQTTGLQGRNRLAIVENRLLQCRLMLGMRVALLETLEIYPITTTEEGQDPLTDNVIHSESGWQHLVIGSIAEIVVWKAV